MLSIPIHLRRCSNKLRRINNINFIFYGQNYLLNREKKLRPDYPILYTQKKKNPSLKKKKNIQAGIDQ